MVALVLVMLGGGAVAGVLLKTGKPAVTPQQLSTQTIPPPASQANQVIPASNAAVMGLQKLSAKPAQNFSLTDQHNQTVSLAQLDASHAVVLTFMDDRCRDVCPIVAQELVDAYRDLGAEAAKVDFVAVNVNAAHNATRWLNSFITEQGPAFASLPNFYYLTGSSSALRKIWNDYKITVKVDPTSGTVEHTDAMYFLSPGGTEHYQATPYANMRKNGTGWLPPATMAQWGHGIAQYAKAVAPPPASPTAKG